jgi:hypothetical protein
MERIDVSMVYSHLTWSLWFFIYLITSLYGIYTIWTDLKGYGAGKEDFIMALLVSLWMALAYGLWAVTERFV